MRLYAKNQPPLEGWPDEPRETPQRGKCLDRGRRGRRGQRVQSFELFSYGLAASRERIEDGLVFRRDGAGVVLKRLDLPIQFLHVRNEAGNGAVHAVGERILLCGVFHNYWICHDVCSFGCAAFAAVYWAGVLASKASSFRATRPERASSVSRIFWSSVEGVQPACNRASIAFKSQRVTRFIVTAQVCARTASVFAQTASVKCFTRRSSESFTSGHCLVGHRMSMGFFPYAFNSTATT